MSGGGKEESKEQNIEADGAEEYETERDESAGDQEEAADGFEDANDRHPVVVDHEKGPGASIAGRHGRVHKRVELIQSEDEEHQPEKQTADQSGNFH